MVAKNNKKSDVQTRPPILIHIRCGGREKKNTLASPLFLSYEGMQRMISYSKACDDTKSMCVVTYKILKERYASRYSSHEGSHEVKLCDLCGFD